MTHLQLLALVIPYLGNTKERFDPGFSVDTFYMNKLNLCYPFFTQFGSTVRGKGNPRGLLPLVILYSGTLRYDITLISALLFYINTCQFC